MRCTDWDRATRTSSSLRRRPDRLSARHTERCGDDDDNGNDDDDHDDGDGDDEDRSLSELRDTQKPTTLYSDCD